MLFRSPIAWRQFTRPLVWRSAGGCRGWDPAVAGGGRGPVVRRRSASSRRAAGRLFHSLDDALGEGVVDDAGLAAEVHDAHDDAVPRVGVGTAGPVVLCAAAVDSRITRVATVNSLSSYISDVPYRGQRFGVLAPGILRDVGDIEHIASLVAPRPLTIAGGMTGGGVALDDASLKTAYDFTQQAYGLAAKEPALTIRAGEFDVAMFLKAK